MLPHLGFFLLFMCCLATGWGFFSATGAAMLRHRRLWRSSQMSLYVTCAMALAAAVIFWIVLFQRDYSVGYVWRNSSNDLPAFYTFTTFWSALEGSHFFWTLLLTIFATIGLATVSRDNEHIAPYVSASLQLVLCWMFWLAISYSDPFAMQFPVHDNGLGKNPLLQNPYMVIHPPTLFIGYTAMGIPFAYSVAALWYGDITEGWLKTVRRWTIFSWIFLTAGIALGGRWAYVELGWAGYWAWDPVENSSFMPWLFSTALLHSLVVQDKLGHLKRLSIVLAILGFFFCYFGTFITRSGVITSVHSFADGNIGPSYLMFLAGLLGAVALLYGLRAHSILPADTEKVWGFSKESALVVTQFLILTFAVIVFIGTIFPIVSEAVSSQRISVQAPYFNAFAPWVGLGIIVAIAVGNLMRYHTSKMPGGKRIMLLSTGIAVIPTVLLIWLGDVMRTPRPFALGAQIAGMYLCCWSASCLSLDLVDRLKDLRWNWKLFFQRNLAYFGGYVAHIGMLVAIVGFLGNYRGIDKQVTLSAGEKTELYGYDISFSGISIREDHNVTLFEAPLKVSRDGKELGEIFPARSKYPTKDELLNEIGVKSSLWYDIYAVMADFDKQTGRQVTLQLHINPTVRFVWISVVIMVIGAFIGLFDKIRGTRSRDVVAGAWEVGT
jgi:cytochrome c-type biogenesis protein CcmF